MIDSAIKKGANNLGETRDVLSSRKGLSPKKIREPCAGCGSLDRRSPARYCAICGKFLNEAYMPLDRFRSSNRLHGKTFLVENAGRRGVTNLFAQDKNTAAESARASLVYSLVPYLGVLFIPFTIGFGFYGVAIAYRQPYLGGRKIALVSIGLSLVVLIFQGALWWLFYLVPKLGTPI